MTDKQIIKLIVIACNTATAYEKNDIEKMLSSADSKIKVIGVIELIRYAGIGIAEANDEEPNYIARNAVKPRKDYKGPSLSNDDLKINEKYVYREVLCDSVILIDPAINTAKEVYEYLLANNLLNKKGDINKSEFFISVPVNVGHPRSFGTFPRVLGVYVREKKLPGWEEAVRKMTSAPANQLGLADRGILRPGMIADIVVFNPETVKDRATFDNPSPLVRI